MIILLHYLEEKEEIINILLASREKQLFNRILRIIYSLEIMLMFYSFQICLFLLFNFLRKDEHNFFYRINITFKNFHNND